MCWPAAQGCKVPAPSAVVTSTRCRRRRRRHRCRRSRRRAPARLRAVSSLFLVSGCCHTATQPGRMMCDVWLCARGVTGLVLRPSGQFLVSIENTHTHTSG